MRTYEGMRNSSLAALAERLRKEEMRKHDIIVPVSAMRMFEDATIWINEVPLNDKVGQMLQSMGIEVQGAQKIRVQYDLLDTAHAQLAAKTDIRSRYYQKMLAEDDNILLSANVNYWLEKMGNQNVFLRTFIPEDGGSPGTIRAILSERYQVIDNLDLLFTLLQTIKSMGLKVNVDSCNLTESHMFVSVTAPDVHLDAPELLRGYRNPETGVFSPRLTSGFVIQNSEVGRGAFQIVPRPVANCCFNALTWKPHNLRRVHLGGVLEEGVVDWSNKTRQKASEIVESQVEDAIRTFLSKDYLEKLVAVMLDKGDRPLEHPTQAVTNVCRLLNIDASAQDEIMGYFINSGDNRVIGVAQALTFYAQRTPDADVQFQIEESISEVVVNSYRWDVN